MALDPKSTSRPGRSRRPTGEVEALFAAYPGVAAAGAGADCPTSDPRLTSRSPRAGSSTWSVCPASTVASRPAGPLRPAAVARPPRRCARQRILALAADCATGAGMPDRVGIWSPCMRKRGHGGAEPGVEPARSLPPHASRSSRTCPHATLEDFVGPSGANEPYPCHGPRIPGGASGDSGLRERHDVRPPGSLRSPPGTA